MKHLSYFLPAVCAGFLAACQSSGATDSRSESAEMAQSSFRGADSQAAPAGGVTGAHGDGSYPGPGTPAHESAWGTAAAPPEQETGEARALAAQTSEDVWGPGMMHVGLSASFFEDDEDTAGQTENLHIEGEYGYLLTDNIEVNVSGTYDSTDFGTTDTSRAGGFAGLRLYLLTPENDSDIGVYGEGKIGLINNDNVADDDTNTAGGVGAGLLWWPWGIERGMAFDVSVDWTTTKDVDRLGAFVGLGFWW